MTTSNRTIEWTSQAGQPIVVTVTVSRELRERVVNADGDVNDLDASILAACWQARWRPFIRCWDKSLVIATRTASRSNPPPYSLRVR